MEATATGGGSGAASGRASPDPLIALSSVASTTGTEVPLLDYIANIMRFVDAFLNRRSSTLVQEFVQKRGLGGTA